MGQWYYLDGDRTTRGPWDEEQLKELSFRNTFSPNTLFWTNSFGSEWKPLSSVHQLAPLLRNATEGLELSKSPPGNQEKSFVDDDGTRYEWDEASGKFVPVDIEYAIEDMVFPDGQSGGQVEESPSAQDKLKMQALVEAQERSNDAKKRNAPGWFDAKNNTSVYIQGLPLDACVEEVAEVFSKCGVIKIDIETGGPRVKIYKNKELSLIHI